MSLRACVLSVMFLAGPALAETPRVAADIAAVHSLVAKVMEGAGTPALIMPPDASPHHYSLRPSEAAALEGADVVIAVGTGLSPSFDRAAETLSAGARIVTLLDTEGTTLLPAREGVAFGDAGHGEHDDGHGHDEHGHDDHGHGDHGHDDAHAHDKEHGHDDDHAAADEDAHGHEHDKDHGEGHGHGHEDDHAHDKEHAGGHDDHAHDDHAGHDHAIDGADPHAWLDPVNAMAWLDAIAQELSDVDPANAALYAENAAQGRAELEALVAEINAQLAPVRGRSFIVFHDAYQYFEARFGLTATAAVSLGDAAKPGAARIAALRDLVAEAGVSCVFTEPQLNPGILGALAEEGALKISELDPQGAGLEPGPDFYPALLWAMAGSMADCL